jgi:hypothetical protein
MSKIANNRVWRGKSGIILRGYENVKNATFHKVTVEKSNTATA